MKLIVILIAAAVSLPIAARAECLPSARAVRAEHGISAWSTWRNIDGQRCWMMGERHAHRANGARMAVHNSKGVAFRLAPHEPSSSEMASQPNYGGAVEPEAHPQKEKATSALKCNLACRQLYQEFIAWRELEALYMRAR